MSAPTLCVHDLARTYPLPRKGLFGPKQRFTAVAGASFSIAPGETLGVVGESGSGKSTLARMVMGLEPIDRGAVVFEGQPIHTLSQARLRALRARFQMIFQDPVSSLDPRRTIGWSIAEPLRMQPDCARKSHERAVAQALELVGLKPADARRYPHEFSGGQRQRIAIARAIVTRPTLIVADEPVSALDVSVQAQVLNLLMDLQEDIGLSMLFISHDLAVVGAISDTIMVMQAGEVVESGTAARILSTPKAAYTRLLLDAAGAESAASERVAAQ